MKLDPTTIGNLYDRSHIPRPDGLAMFAVRGALVNNGSVLLNTDAYDFWNDTIGLVDFQTGEMFGFWAATAGQPGTYWTKHSDYAGADSGAPFTMPCGNIALTTGLHRGKWWSLIQRDGVAGSYPVVRDTDQDEVLEARDKFTWTTRANGINVHWEELKSQRVRFASSGCHVMNYAYNSKERKAFKDVVERYQKQGQQTIRYSVFEGSWMIDGRERVLYGSVGDGVKWFQNLLNTDGYPVRVDGEFGQLTHERAVQRSRALFKAGTPNTLKVDQWGVGIVPEPAKANPYELAIAFGGHGNIIPFTMPDGKTAQIKVRDLAQAFGATVDSTKWPKLAMQIGAEK